MTARAAPKASDGRSTIRSLLVTLPFPVAGLPDRMLRLPMSSFTVHRLRLRWR
jgi:hypothetical protein